MLNRVSRFAIPCFCFVLFFLFFLTGISYACGVVEVLIPSEGILLIAGMLMFLIIMSTESLSHAAGLIGIYAGYFAVPIIYLATKNTYCSFFRVDGTMLLLLILYTLFVGNFIKAWVKTLIITAPMLLLLMASSCSSFYGGGIIIVVVIGMSWVYGCRAIKKLIEEKYSWVIPILLAIVIYGNYYLTSKIVSIPCSTLCQSNLKNIATALELYKVDKQSYPSSLQQLCPAYLKEVTQCDSKPRNILLPITYKEIGVYKPVPYEYEVSTESDRYTITCWSENHYFACKPGFPRYTSVNGMETENH